LSVTIIHPYSLRYLACTQIDFPKRDKKSQHPLNYQVDVGLPITLTLLP